MFQKIAISGLLVWGTYMISYELGNSAGYKRGFKDGGVFERELQRIKNDKIRK